jgi:hypothetical protein
MICLNKIMPTQSAITPAPQQKKRQTPKPQLKKV